VFLTQIVADKVQKVDLCEECAKQKGLDDPAGFSPADVLLGLGAAEIEQAAGGSELKCPKCGFTQADFKKSGRLGCAECYATFAEGLEGTPRVTERIARAPELLELRREPPRAESARTVVRWRRVALDLVCDPRQLTLIGVCAWRDVEAKCTRVIEERRAARGGRSERGQPDHASVRRLSPIRPPDRE